MRGMIPFVGFNQMVLEYTEAFRSCGLSKYRFSDRLNLAVRGIVGFSTRPLTLVIWIGLSILALVGGYLIYLIVSILFFGMSFLPGWTSIVALIGILTGIQITTLGIVGLYVGKIFLEVKKRPRYLVKEVYDNDK